MEQVGGRMHRGGAVGAGVGVGEAYCVAEGEQSGALPRSQLSESGAECSWEMGLGGRDLGGLGLENFVRWTVGDVALDGRGMDRVDG